MSIVNLKKLQNGSDIRGVALEGASGEAVTLNEEATDLIAQAFLMWLCKDTKKNASDIKVAVGHDSRISADSLKNAVIKGLSRFSPSIFDCGLASTPAMFMSTVFPDFDCDGAIMITASHLPYNRNGFKFFSRKGGLNKGDITAILQRAEDLFFGSQEDKLLSMGQALERSLAAGGVQKMDLLSAYAEFLRNKIKEGVDHPENYALPLTGLHIVVDAGNGAGGFYADKVLAPLGADISGSQFLEPDGTFPNHAPNPEDKEAMKSVSQAVTSHNADFGLIFDTDVDRSSAVDRRGREINRNSIVALAAALVAETNPGTTIVTDSVTSDELTAFIERELGCNHHRFKRGYKNVINEAIRLNEEGIDSQLAIETSGHAALKENYFLDDGAYLATKIVVKAACLALEGKTLDGMIKDLKGPKEALEVRLAISSNNFNAYGDKIISELELFAHVGPGMMVAMPSYEGVRISFDGEHGNGWCLLRKSLHDPIMPLNIESGDRGGCKEIGRTLLDFLSSYDKLDVSKLKTFCSR